MNARYYDPSTGRFLSEDPIGFKAADTNLYKYTTNTPITSTDPSGKFSLASVAFCGVAIAAGQIYDSVSSIKEGADLAQAYQSKIDDLKEEKKTCSSTRKVEIDIEMNNLTKQYQKEAMVGAGSVYTPGAGAQIGAAACVAALIFF